MADLAPWTTNNRLPTTTLVQNYDLYLHPDLSTKSFNGHVVISLNTTEKTDYFLIHSKSLEINFTSLRLNVLNENGETKPLPISDAFLYAPHEFLIVRLGSEAPPGRFQLAIDFSGSLKGRIVSFYYSEYSTKSGEKRPLATSKFEPTYGREAFPCLDEPGFRASFTTTLVRPSEGKYISLTNMPLKEERVNHPSSGLTESIFERSVPMASYLACFIVCDFAFKEEMLKATSKRGPLPMRIYAPQERLNATQFALSFGSQTLAKYEDLFDSPFPLPKSDMASIPDYSSGATEHWGIITFRETSVLFEETTGSAKNLQSIASTVAHELAHQWFGNLVTMEWWDDLWLNEGFASYVQYKGVNYSFPEWDMMSQFVAEKFQNALHADARLSSHPIVRDVTTPNQINAMFDTISYDKGSSVLRMLEDFLGEDVFRNGVNAFLREFAFKNARTPDLWRSLTEASRRSQNPVDVGEAMDSWTCKTGYPVLTVSHDATSLRITQHRFLSQPDPSAKGTSDSLWDVPVTVIFEGLQDNVRPIWFNQTQSYLDVPVPENASWFKLNARRVGFYRVNYAVEDWEKLQAVCEKKLLGPEDRASLFDDALSLSASGLLPYSSSLAFSRALSMEEHLVPWSVSASKFNEMQYLLLECPETNMLLKSHVRNLVESLYKQLGWQDNGTHLQRLLRSVIVNSASLSGLTSSLDEAHRLLGEWIRHVNYPLPRDTKRLVYWWGMAASSSSSDWEVMWQRCLKEQDAAQKLNLYYGLANVQDKQILSKYIELTFDLSNTKMQDFLTVMQYISLNPAGVQIAWDWVRTHWEDLSARYGPDDRYLGQLIPNISQYFASQRLLKEMNEFYEKHGSTGSVVEYHDQAIETVQNNIRWVELYEGDIRAWLEH